MDISLYYSYLDSERFGLKVAKVNLFPEKPEILINQLKKEGIQLIISKIDANHINLINQLEHLGFKLKDSQVTYRYNLKKDIIDFPDLKNSKFQIREFDKKDIPCLQKIAKESFNNYGHYANDSRLDKSQIGEIYSDWITRSCMDLTVADKVFLAEHENKIAGFLSMKLFKSQESYYAASGLGAVSSNYRGQNVFKLLTAEALNWGAGINLDWEEHNVLTTNFPVNGTFSSLGFKIYKSFFTFHYWC
jgi:GNAT superfamily N-acetyltransferase